MVNRNTIKKKTKNDGIKFVELMEYSRKNVYELKRTDKIYIYNNGLVKALLL